MKYYVPVSKFMFLFLLMNIQSIAQSGYPNADEIIIKFKTTTNNDEKSSLLNTLQAQRKSPSNLFVETWQTPSTTTLPNGKELKTSKDYIAYLNQQEVVAYAEPNYKTQILNLPNDQQLNELWGLQNTGQTGGLSGADIHAVQAWDIRTDATSTPIAILDTGIDWQHEDLAENIWQNLAEDADGDGQVLEWNGTVWIFDPGDENGIDDDNNGYIDDFIGWDFVNQDNNPMDDNGHGTHVAGIAGAKGNNSIGTTGIAWDAQLLALKVFTAEGTGSIADVIAALNYTIQQNIKITNNSWGTLDNSIALHEAIANTQNIGQLFIAAAGNSGTNNDLPFGRIYPAAYDFDNIIAVASTNKFDQKTNFSNYGAITIDIGTPGRGIYSTLPGNSYGSFYGTSMSAPYVSGAAALLWSECDALSANQLKETLLSTAKTLPALEGKWVSGGRLDLFNALSTLTTPNANFTVTNTGLSIELLAKNTMPGTSYTWNFGDGASAISPTPTHIYSSEGNYPVCLTVTRFEHSNTFCKNITVTENGNTDDCETEWVLQTHGDRFQALAVDGEYVWGGTTGGLLKFNRLSGDFIFYNTVNSGLPHNDVLAVEVDLNGYLWLGTGNGGLAKFDGISWTVYTTENSGLPHNKVNDIAISPTGEIWLATDGGGAARFDGNSTWETFDASNILPSGTGYGFNVINDIEIADDGIVWMGMPGEGLVKFDGSISTNYRTAQGLLHNSIYALSIDPTTEDLWIGTQTGITQFTPSTEIFVPIDSFNTKTSAIHVSPQGKLWFGTNTGVHEFGTDGTITTHNGASTAYELRSNTINTITQDENGNVWVATGRSLSKYDNTTWTGYRYFNNEIPGNNVLGITQVPSGEIFIGTHSGLLRIAEDSTYQYSVGNSDLTTTEIRDIIGETDGTVWLATRKGIVKITQFDNPYDWTLYDTLGTSGTSIMAQDFHSLAKDHNGVLWAVITNGGLLKFDGTAWTFISPNNSLLPTYAVRDIAFDTVQQNMWIATTLGLVKVDSNDNWAVYTTDDGLKNNTINTVCTDEQGNVWLGSDWGISFFDGATFTNYHPNNSGIIHPKILTLHTDANTGNIWVGTKEGLCKFDGTDKWTTYNSGSINISDPVQAIEITTDGKKWIGTYGGLSTLSGNLASFYYSNYSPCTDSIITFYNTSEYATSGDWYVNDLYISSAPAMSYNFPSKGIYSIKLITNSGGICTSEFSKEIVIGDHINLLDLPDSITVCDDYYLIDTELDNLASYRWYFNNLMVGNQSTYTATESGQYILVAEDQCNNSKSDTLWLTIEDNCAWPGDANDDGIVNLFDVLRIGQAYNATGTQRPPNTTAWEAQQSENWNTIFSDNINYKHADTNGDGIINLDDIDIISSNYQKTHGLNPAFPVSDAGGEIQLVLNINSPTILNNVANTTIDLTLEHSTGEAINAYGLAFTLNHGGELESTDFSNSSFGEDLITFVKGQPGQQTDIVIVRKDNNNVTANGATATIATLENIPTGEPEISSLSILNISQVQLIDKDGNSIPINSQIATYASNNPMDVIANAQPVNCDGAGQVETSITGGNPPYVYNWNNGATTSYLDNLESGLYYLTVTDSDGTSIETVTFVDDKSIRLQAAASPEASGLANGIATVVAAGGTSPYTYLWNTGQTGASIAGLEAGTYTVSVTDASGCVQEAFITVPGDIILNTRVFLEGAYNTSSSMMRDALRSRQLVPNASPYHPQEKTLPQIFNIHDNNAITDWIKLELIDPTDFTVLESRSALLQKDGDLVELDGTTPVNMSISEDRDALLLIQHRNHLSIISEELVTSNIVFNTDFTQQNANNSPGILLGQKQLLPGVWAMYAGEATNDFSGNEDINGDDKSIWSLQNGTFDIYAIPDFNLDGDISGADKIIWQQNNGIFNNLPN